VPILRYYKCDVCLGEQASVHNWYLVRKLGGLSLQITRIVGPNMEGNLESNERIVCNRDNISCLVSLVKSELGMREDR
jgi:hypothetical protein